jgi:hypothetical protein
MPLGIEMQAPNCRFIRLFTIFAGWRPDDAQFCSHITLCHGERNRFRIKNKIKVKMRASQRKLVALEMQTHGA